MEPRRMGVQILKTENPYAMVKAVTVAKEKLSIWAKENNIEKYTFAQQEMAWGTYIGVCLIETEL